MSLSRITFLSLGTMRSQFAICLREHMLTRRDDHVRGRRAARDGCRARPVRDLAACASPLLRTSSPPPPRPPR